MANNPRDLIFSERLLLHIMGQIESRVDPVQSALAGYAEMGISIQLTSDEIRTVRQRAHSHFMGLTASFQDSTLLARVWVKAIEDVIAHQHSVRVLFPHIELITKS